MYILNFAQLQMAQFIAGWRFFCVDVGMFLNRYPTLPRKNSVTYRDWITEIRLVIDSRKSLLMV